MIRSLCFIMMIFGITIQNAPRKYNHSVNLIFVRIKYYFIKSIHVYYRLKENIIKKNYLVKNI